MINRVSLLIVSLLAPFFQSCVTEQDLDELNIEIIRSTLYKVRCWPLKLDLFSLRPQLFLRRLWMVV